MADSTRYTNDQIMHYEQLAADRRRHCFYAVPIVIAVLFAMMNLNGGLIFCAIIASCIGIGVYVRPRSISRKYAIAKSAWTQMLERSNPATILTVDFALQETEQVFYSELCERYEERRTGQVIDTQSRTKNAIGSAAVGGLLFGPAGAIIGGSMARRRTTGTATDVYNVVPVDHGHVAITSTRFVFMGARDTIELPIERVMRYSSLEETNRINVEYAGRKPGESYTVVPALFNLCMARRARDSRFQIPIPPPPLAHDANAGIVLRPSTSEVALAS